MQTAVIATGGKQYIVSPGKTLTIEKIIGEHKPGDTLTFGEVLLMQDENTTHVGKPFVSGASVTGTLQEIGRAKKVVVVHFKPKARQRKKAGHRQPFFKVEITGMYTGTTESGEIKPLIEV